MLLNLVPCIEVSCSLDSSSGNVIFLHRISKCIAESWWLFCRPSSCHWEILCLVSHIVKAGKSVVCCCVCGDTDLPKEVTGVAAKASALHGPLIFDWALHSDVHAFLHCTVISCGKKNGLMLTVTNWKWWNHPCSYGLPPSVLSGTRKSFLPATGLATCT